jgi:hypothetical protein
MVRPGNIGQIIAKILGAAGRTARQPATAPLIDLERRNAGAVQRCGVVDAAVLDAARAVHHDDRRHLVLRTSGQLKPRPNHDCLPVPNDRVRDLVNVEKRRVFPRVPDPTGGEHQNSGKKCDL